MPLTRNFYTVNKKRRYSDRWYVSFRDHNEVWRRMSAFLDRKASETMDRRIQELVRYRLDNEVPDTALLAWVEGLPPKSRDYLVSIALLDKERVLALLPLLDQLKGKPGSPGWEQYLTAKGNSAKHVRTFVMRVERIIKGCGFVHWSDVTATKVLDFIHKLREDTKNKDGTIGRGIGAQTFNFYVSSFKSFARWMVREGRSSRNPVEHMQGMNVRTDRRHDRRPLSEDEVRWLLRTTRQGPSRCGMTGPERAMIYRLAVETGLRSSELASLTSNSFDLDAKPPTVTVKASFSKRRRQDVLLLRPGTAKDIETFLQGKSPEMPAFNMPKKKPMADPLRKDLAEARSAWIAAASSKEEQSKRLASRFLEYRDEHQEFADFHALRHTASSLLAEGKVSPKVAQTLMRHSDINLTMIRYAHLYRGQEAQAVKKLPDFGEEQRGQSEEAPTPATTPDAPAKRPEENA